jgi:tripartite-type tricarboxylate transporter receptor subunit TctC
MLKYPSWRLAGPCVAMLLAVSSNPSFAQGAGHGGPENSIDMIVGMPPGGSIDGYARMVQRHLPKYLPDNASIVVKNKPGAGSLLAMMTVANGDPKDDLMMGTFSSALIPDAVIDPQRFKIDFRKFRFIGSIGADYRVCYVRSATGIKDLKELAAHPNIAFSSSAPGSSGMLNLAILQSFLNVKVRQVRGYPGSAAKRLAVERGEVDGDCGSIDLIPPEWLTEHKVNVLGRFLPTLPAGVDKNIPFVGDLLKNSDERKVYDFLIMPTRLVGTFLVSDKVAPEKVKELRQGFDRMVKDPGFIADAERARLVIVYSGGEQLDREIADLYTTPPEIISKAKAILAR